MPRVALELHPEEQVIFAGHPSWRGTLSYYLRGALGAIAAAAIAAAATAIGSSLNVALTIAVLILVFGLVVLAGFLFRLSTTYTITNQRLTIERGILSRHVQQTRVERVQNVNTDQRIRDRLLRVGTVDFDTAGTDDSDFKFVGISNPVGVAQAVDRALRDLQAPQL